jgi:glycosyltransferase involved in cell wall biosynthesis
MTLLSILIPSIPSRAETFVPLWVEINRQAEWVNTIHVGPGTVEVIIDDSPAFLDGGLSIGKKREELVKRASGKYLCFLDDDEGIAPNYLQVLIELCKKGKDVCTFMNISKLDNFWMIVNMSLHHKENEQGTNGIIKRLPWHICPVKSLYAKVVAFDDINYGEDWKWFEKVLSHCRTEAHSEAVIHQYNHSSKKSEADKITNYEKLQPIK